MKNPVDLHPAFVLELAGKVLALEALLRMQMSAAQTRALSLGQVRALSIDLTNAQTAAYPWMTPEARSQTLDAALKSIEEAARWQRTHPRAEPGNGGS